MPRTAPRAAKASPNGHQELVAGTIAVECPANRRVVGHVPDQSPAEVAETVRALREQQVAWEGLGAKGRAKWLGRFRDWILDNEETIAQILHEETAKPWQEASMEVTVSVDVLNYYADRGAEFLAEQTPRPHNLLTATKRLRVIHRPYPVVGVITPWNFPLALPMLDVMPALMAGCAVITKPSEVTPLAWREMVRGWREDVGAPDVLACVTGLGATGAAIVDEADYVQFTGSTVTGRKIAQRAGERLVPYSLELGGKDPMIVCADADLERTVNGAAWGGLLNSGQVCVSVERIYVEAPVYDEFVERLVEKVGELRQGKDTGRYQADVGAMATEAQVEIVERHVNEAVAAGARALTGGKRGDDGLFFEPTVLVDVDHSMSCMREETFGPTLPVMKVADAEEAIRLANDSPYGLSATVWTKDRAKAEQIARRLDAGAVNINGALSNLFAFPVPHSGWKESGIGARLGGPYGMRKYCRTQAITSDRVELKAELFWFPYSAFKGALGSRIARGLMARDLRRRLGLSPRGSTKPNW
jgi:acyl-CoA reductase-like NAD-dependent aldehyde dehydrogenase